MNLNKDKLLAQINLIRSGAAIFLIDTAQLKRRTGEQYINGESRPIYSAPVAIKCRLITRSGSESENIAAQAREIQQTNFTGLYRMQIPYELDVREGDQILVTDAITNIVKTLDVIFAPAKHIYSAAVVIQLQEVK